MIIVLSLPYPTLRWHFPLSQRLLAARAQQSEASQAEQLRQEELDRRFLALDDGAGGNSEGQAVLEASAQGPSADSDIPTLDLDLLRRAAAASSADEALEVRPLYASGQHLRPARSDPLNSCFLRELALDPVADPGSGGGSRGSVRATLPRAAGGCSGRRQRRAGHCLPCRHALGRRFGHCGGRGRRSLRRCGPQSQREGGSKGSHGGYCGGDAAAAAMAGRHSRVPLCAGVGSGVRSACVGRSGGGGGHASQGSCPRGGGCAESTRSAHLAAASLNIIVGLAPHRASPNQPLITQEVPFGLVVRSPSAPPSPADGGDRSPLALVRPSDGEQRAACSVSRYQFELFSGDVARVTSQVRFLRKMVFLL